MIVAREVFHEEGLGCGRLCVTARVRHRLPAAGLVEGIVDLAPEPFQQLECGDADLRLKRVHVARNEEANTHDHSPLVIFKVEPHLAAEHEIDRDLIADISQMRIPRGLSPAASRTHLGHLEGDRASVSEDPGANLHQPVAQRCHGPVAEDQWLTSPGSATTR